MNRRVAGVAGLCLSMIAAQAQAQAPAQDSAIDWSIGFGLASDFVGKGVSKNSGDPALSGTAEISRGGLYANVFASSADLSSGAHAEVVTTAGWRGEVGAFGIDVAAVNRDLPGTRDGVQSNYTEYQADLIKKIGRFSGRLRVNYTPDGFAATQEAWWIEAQGTMTIDTKTKASLAFADRSADGGAEYRAWNVGVKRKVTDLVAVDVRWYDTDAHDLGQAYDGNLVVALTFAL